VRFCPAKAFKGFTLIELLVVVAIIAILGDAFAKSEFSERKRPAGRVQFKPAPMGHCNAVAWRWKSRLEKQQEV